MRLFAVRSRQRILGYLPMRMSLGGGGVLSMLFPSNALMFFEKGGVLLLLMIKSLMFAISRYVASFGNMSYILTKSVVAPSAGIGNQLWNCRVVRGFNPPHFGMLVPPSLF